jgi:hypothetical protein
LRKELAEASALLESSLTWAAPRPPALPPVLGQVGVALSAALGALFGLWLFVRAQRDDPSVLRYVPTKQFERLGGSLWLSVALVVGGPFVHVYRAQKTIVPLANEKVWAGLFSWSAGEVAVPIALVGVVIALFVALPVHAVAVARLFFARRVAFPRQLALHVGLVLALVALDDFGARMWPNAKAYGPGYSYVQTALLLGWLFYVFHADRSLGTFLRRRSGEVVAAAAKADLTATPGAGSSSAEMSFRLDRASRLSPRWARHGSRVRASREGFCCCLGVLGTVVHASIAGARRRGRRAPKRRVLAGGEGQGRHVVERVLARVERRVRCDLQQRTTLLVWVFRHLRGGSQDFAVVSLPRRDHERASEQRTVFGARRGPRLVGEQWAVERV